MFGVWSIIGKGWCISAGVGKFNVDWRVTIEIGKQDHCILSILH